MDRTNSSDLKQHVLIFFVGLFSWFTTTGWSDSHASGLLANMRSLFRSVEDLVLIFDCAYTKGQILEMVIPLNIICNSY
jgi:hypothetical protein